MAAHDNIVWLVVFDCVYAAVLCGLVYFAWRPMFRPHPEHRFNYSIVEIWAGIIGITPNYLILKYFPEIAWIIPILLMTQLTLMVLMKMDADTRANRSQVLSVSSILLGAVLALGATPILSGAIAGVAMVALIVFGIAFIAAPVWLPISMVAALAILARKKRQRE